MIISHQHQFIFMHSRKTAGSSVSTALNRYLGQNDIQIGGWVDAIKGGGKYNAYARSYALYNPVQFLREMPGYCIKTKQLRISPELINNNIKDYFNKQYGFHEAAHVGAKKVRDFDRQNWQRYFKFGFVRNPWDHAVSDYHWRSKAIKNNKVSFKEFLARLQDTNRDDPEGIRPPIITNWSVYTIDDEVALDYVGQYENINDELKTISRLIGVEVNIQNVSSKKKVRPRNTSIRDYYDDESLALVEQIYAREIHQFDYRRPF